VITGFNRCENKIFGIAPSYTAEYNELPNPASSFSCSTRENTDVENSYYGSVSSGLCIGNVI
jgi:hypothetical protein